MNCIHPAPFASMNPPLSLSAPLLFFVTALGGACTGTASVNEEDDVPLHPVALEEPFEVLLLGDSISIGYTPHVQAALAGRAHVQRPLLPDGKRAENCAGTTKGIANIERWLAREGGAWDVIHFNFGLHDLKRVQPDSGKNSNDPAHPHQASPAVYARQLAMIVDALERSGARLVFATTTPVPEGGVKPHRNPEDVVRFNEIASILMHERGIPVNDLYEYARPRLAELQQPVNVHFTPEGSRALGKQVTAAILAAAGLEASASAASETAPAGR